MRRASPTRLEEQTAPPPSGVDRGAGEPQAPRFTGPKRVGIAAAATLVSVNIWTGAPLLAVWVGSRVVPQSGLSMGAVFLVVVVLIVSVLLLVAALGRLSAKYDELTGSAPAARRVSPWLRSMRGERDALLKREHSSTAIERILVITVVAAVMALELWFFFFAGSSLPNS